MIDRWADFLRIWPFVPWNCAGVTDVRPVIKIGDTPSDLVEGKNSGCLSLGITNGTHTREQLSQYENNGLMDNLDRSRTFLSDFV